ncbi:MAG: hypothetical protein ABEJ88_09545 [Halobacterium sp.]
MQPCHNYQAVIDEYTLDKQLEPLCDLTADDFNVCADCATVVADECVECGGAVYVPRSVSVTPDYCQACRSVLIDLTGEDPGWHCEPVSH